MLTPPNNPCDYPERLLPSNEKFKKLNYDDNSLLCRKSIEKNKMLDDDGDLEMVAFEVEELIDYSVNLISNTLDIKPEDVLIEVEEKHYTREEWDTSKDNLVPSADILNASIAEHKGYFVFKIGDIQFQGHFDFLIKPKKPIKRFEFKITPKHTPNLINIAHFELHCESNITGKMKRVKRDLPIKEKSYRHILVHAIRDKMIDICYTSVD